MISLALILAGLTASPGESYDSKSMPTDYWRNPRRCGPNCLYAYLSIHGHTVPLGAILERVPIGAQGANLADLRRAASDLGVPSRVVKATPGRLGGFPLPAIAHFQSREGHFVLVLQVTPDTVTTADMLGGSVEALPADLFFERWSGFLLVPGMSSSILGWPVLAAGAIVATVLALCRPRKEHRIRGEGS